MNTPKTAITMSAVKSSQISAIGHDSASNTLAVQFNSGGTYHYHDVPAEKFAALQGAESVGAYLGKNIKGAHEFTKIGEKE